MSRYRKTKEEKNQQVSKAKKVAVCLKLSIWKPDFIMTYRGNKSRHEESKKTIENDGAANLTQNNKQNAQVQNERNQPMDT